MIISKEAQEYGKQGATVFPELANMLAMAWQEGYNKEALEALQNPTICIRLDKLKERIDIISEDVVNRTESELLLDKMYKRLISILQKGCVSEYSKGEVEKFVKADRVMKILDGSDYWEALEILQVAKGLLTEQFELNGKDWKFSTASPEWIKKKAKDLPLIP